jgi:hypothetical protein
MNSTARLVLAGLAVIATPRIASAGRSHFAWLYGTDIVPERGTEIETWILEENGEGNKKERETAFWWGPVVALTPHLEFAIAIEADYSDPRDGSPPAVHFSRWGGEFRYRVQSPDPIDAGPFVTKFRVAAKRLIEDRAGYQLEGDVIASFQKGRVFVLADIGGVVENVPGARELQLRPGGGISFRVTKELRVGVESYGELVVDGPGTSWYVVGPSVALTSGRFWGAAAYGIGILGIDNAPRVTFGVAL